MSKKQKHAQEELLDAIATAAALDPKFAKKFKSALNKMKKLSAEELQSAAGGKFKALDIVGTGAKLVGEATGNSEMEAYGKGLQNLSKTL
jgi:hypothetical protein